MIEKLLEINIFEPLGIDKIEEEKEMDSATDEGSVNAEVINLF